MLLSVGGLIALLESSKYPLLFVGCYIEGAVIMMATGTLVHLGTVELLPAFLTLLAADLAADITWYYVGALGARSFVARWGHLFGASPEALQKVERRFHQHHTTILIVSKLTSGVGFAYATLITAGMLRIPLARFLAINLVGGVIWVSVLMTIGFYFGNLLLMVPLEARIVLALAALILIPLLLRHVGKRLAASEW